MLVIATIIMMAMQTRLIIYKTVAGKNTMQNKPFITTRNIGLFIFSFAHISSRLGILSVQKFNIQNTNTNAFKTP
jgi:hypothetical protein